MTPYVSTYGVFLSGRAFDQIRTTVCYNHLKVRFGGAHAGISVGPDGATHQALEDIALARVLPRMTVVAPCDSEEVRKAVLAAADVDGPVYFRFGREATPVITDENTPFTLGKARLVREGTACAVFACGAMVYEALLAAEELAQEGIELLVYDLHTIKPLDEEAVLDAAKTCGAVVTAEEHQLAGGLFGAVSETLVAAQPGAHGGRGRAGYLWRERRPGSADGRLRPERQGHRPGGPPGAGPEGVSREAAHPGRARGAAVGGDGGLVRL